ncbi:MAG: hypothetical protein ACJ74T_17720 [Pyrinomonadaceae bacterium]
MAKRHTRANPLIVIKSTTELVPEKEVRSIIKSLQRQVSEHFQPAWGIDATIVYAEDGKEYPDAYRLNIRRTAKEADKGFIGYHFSEEGYPIATIFAKEDLAEDKTVSDTLSHEILEMLVDPACNLYAHRPAEGRRPARGYFYEVCDAVQAHKYKIGRHLVCNFVYPEWFEHTWAPGKRKFDYLGLLNEPFEVLAECYADVFQRTRGKRPLFRTIWGPDNQHEHAKGKKRHRKGHRNSQRKKVRGTEE